MGQRAVAEPQASDRDVEYILEFANAQLLELRVYDALLDAELPAMYDRVADGTTSHAGRFRRGASSPCWPTSRRASPT